MLTQIHFEVEEEHARAQARELKAVGLRSVISDRPQVQLLGPLRTLA